jgi:hypothetical protein
VVKKINSVKAEYIYDFSVTREEILKEYFNPFLSLIPKARLNSIKEYIFKSEWKIIEREINNLIKTISSKNKISSIDEENIERLIINKNYVKSLYITSFIELDKEFNKYSNSMLDDVVAWSKNHRFVYTKDFILDELEDHILRSYNDFHETKWILTINDKEIIMPSGEIIYGLSPSKEEMVILDTAIYGHEDENDFYEIIEVVRGISRDKISEISKIAEAFQYNAWAKRALDFVKKLSELQKYSSSELEQLRSGVSSLSQDWLGHGEELLTTSENLLIK